MDRFNGLRGFLLVLCVTSSMTSDCVPGYNCKAPTCRCWDDSTTPGRIPVAQTPQMLLLSFEYAVNGANMDSYASLFEGIRNPNGCNSTGTFFVQKNYSSPESIKALFHMGHEIGVTSASGTVPADWTDSFKEVQEFLFKSSGLPMSKVVGTRAPSLLLGGDSQLDAMSEDGLLYDASCVTREYTSPGQLLWPYTYNFVDLTPKCVQGSVPKFDHKGLWQFILTELEINSSISCATPSACSPYLSNSMETFDFLLKNFFKHYNGKRTPFSLFINPQWPSVLHQVEGTMKFLQYIRSGFKDVWIVSHSQALAWMMNPVTSAKATKYAPWSC